jgi:hypothetical protein
MLSLCRTVSGNNPVTCLGERISAAVVVFWGKAAVTYAKAMAKVKMIRMVFLTLKVGAMPANRSGLRLLAV